MQQTIKEYLLGLGLIIGTITTIILLIWKL
jgi:hypothetical protein